jgi:hypothetical protein
MRVALVDSAIIVECTAVEYRRGSMFNALAGMYNRRSAHVGALGALLASVSCSSTSSSTAEPPPDGSNASNTSDASDASSGMAACYGSWRLNVTSTTQIFGDAGSCPQAQWPGSLQGDGSNVTTDTGVACQVSDATGTLCAIDCPPSTGDLLSMAVPYWQFTIMMGSPGTVLISEVETVDDAGLSACLAHGQGTATPF